MANKTEQVLEATENINNREAFFMKYKKAILIAVAAIIVVIAGVFLYISQISGPREEKASTALSKGQTYFNNEMFEQAVNGDGAGFVGFAKLADEYSGTKAGNLANLYAGLCYANLGKWTEAQKSLDAFSTEGDQMISPASQAALGDAYAHYQGRRGVGKPGQEGRGSEDLSGHQEKVCELYARSECRDRQVHRKSF